jgi:NADPH:quinone reductase-like Zn-dependent oxidoreductase
MRDDFAKMAQRYDLILDMAGNRPLSTLRHALTPEGTLVIIGGEEGGRWLGGTDRQIRALLLSPFVRQRLRTFVAKEGAEDLLVLKELIESGKVTPVIDRTYSLREAADAIRHLHEGHARGKLVLSVTRP